jgi:hypothetical protein
MTANVWMLLTEFIKIAYYIFLSLFVKLAFHIFFFSDKGSHGLRELWDTGYQTTICKHWHLWLIISFGQFLEGWNQGFYQYQAFCWNFIKVFRTYHKLGHFQDKQSLDKRRDFSVYVLKINAQEWHHARGILEYANTTIQWEGSIILFFKLKSYPEYVHVLGDQQTKINQ